MNLVLLLLLSIFIFPLVDFCVLKPSYIIKPGLPSSSLIVSGCVLRLLFSKQDQIVILEQRVFLPSLELLYPNFTAIYSSLVVQHLLSSVFQILQLSSQVKAVVVYFLERTGNLFYFELVGRLRPRVQIYCVQSVIWGYFKIRIQIFSFLQIKLP